MNRSKNAVVISIALAASLLSGCSGSTEETDATRAPASAPSSPQSTEESGSPAPTSTPAPTPQGPEVRGLGEPAELPSASITINGAEQRELIESDFDGEEAITPNDGGTLWLLSMNWTNLSNEAVTKVCWGPYTTTVKVDDTLDREMLLDDRSGRIPGNDCTNGLMTGQSGDWFAAYQGLGDSKIGYATIQEGYDSDPIAVVFDDSLDLVYTD